MYAFGVMLNELMAKQQPFAGMGAGEIRSAVLSGGRPELALSAPRAMQELAARCGRGGGGEGKGKKRRDGAGLVCAQGGLAASTFALTAPPVPYGPLHRDVVTPSAVSPPLSQTSPSGVGTQNPRRGPRSTRC